MLVISENDAKLLISA